MLYRSKVYTLHDMYIVNIYMPVFKSYEIFFLSHWFKRNVVPTFSKQIFLIKTNDWAFKNPEKNNTINHVPEQ